MISPTRRFVLTADGKVVNQQMLCNGKSFETGRHRGRGSLSSCCYSSRALFSVLWVGQSISSSYSSASPPHLTSFSCPSFSPSIRPMPLHDNNPTPPSQLNPRSPVYPELQAFFPARLHSSSAAHLQARIDLIQSFPIRLYRHLSLCSLQARPSCKPREGMENASKQRARSHPVFSTPALCLHFALTAYYCKPIRPASHGDGRNIARNDNVTNVIDLVQSFQPQGFVLLAGK